MGGRLFGEREQHAGRVVDAGGEVTVPGDAGGAVELHECRVEACLGPNAATAAS